MVGVHFRPGGARAVLGLPPGEFTDMHLDLETRWGGRARRLRERLCSARAPVERLRILEETLQAPEGFLVTAAPMPPG